MRRNFSITQQASHTIHTCYQRRKMLSVSTLLRARVRKSSGGKHTEVVLPSRPAFTHSSQHRDAVYDANISVSGRVVGGVLSGGFISGGSKPSPIERVRSEILSMKRDQEEKQRRKEQAAAQAQRDRLAEEQKKTRSSLSQSDGNARETAVFLPLMSKWENVVAQSTMGSEKTFMQKRIELHNQHMEQTRHQQVEEIFRGGPTASSNALKNTPMKSHVEKYAKIMSPVNGEATRVRIHKLLTKLYSRMEEIRAKGLKESDRSDRDSVPHGKEGEQGMGLGAETTEDGAKNVKDASSSAVVTGVPTTAAEIALLGNENAILIEALDEFSDDELTLLLKAGVIDIEALWGGGDGDGDTQELDQEQCDDFVLLPKELIDSSASVPMMAKAMLDHDIGCSPSEDVAPTLVHIAEKKFDLISKEEIDALERYEKVQRPVAQKIRPTNAFLSEISSFDEGLKESLGVMERVKRKSVSDEAFQKAMKYVHDRDVAEQKKVQAAVRPTPTPDNVQKPFFFTSVDSIPPPKARHALPNPDDAACVRKAAGRITRSGKRHVRGLYKSSSATQPSVRTGSLPSA